MIQGSPEWFAVRCGRVTASRAKDVLAKIKTGEAASRKNYRAQLVAERLTGVVAESFESDAMRWGTECEPAARAAYEALTGSLVEQVAFVHHAQWMAGASPDGLVDDDGLIECKCPNTATHIETILKGMSPDHIPQIQFQLWITCRAYCDFVSYDPRMPEHLQLTVQRIVRDQDYIEQLAAEVKVFLDEVDQVIAQLNQRKVA